MSKNTVKGFLEIVGADKTIDFWYTPEEIRESYPVGWTNTVIPGLPFPIKNYTGGTSREIMWTLQLALPHDSEHKAKTGADMKVDFKIDDFYSLCMPAPVGKNPRTYIFFAPPILKFYMGQRVTTGVFTNIEVRRVFMDAKRNTTVAEIDITFEQMSVRNY